MPDYNSEGRYQNGSVIAVENGRKQGERQPYFNEGKPWTNQHIDLLFEGFLVHQWCDTSPDLTRPTFQRQLGRSYESWQTKLWKVAANYRREPEALLGEGDRYKPDNRTDRTLLSYTQRDLALVEKATTLEGIRNQAYEPDRLGKVLGRAAAPLWDWMAAAAKTKPRQRPDGLFAQLAKPVPTIQQTTELSALEVAEALQRLLKGTYNVLVVAIKKNQ